MTKRTRRTHAPAFKAKVALAAIKGEKMLADLAQQAGADKAAVSDCQAKGTYDAWTAKATDQSSKDGVNSTPTYLVNGKKVTFVQNQSPVTTLTDLIKAAQ